MIYNKKLNFHVLNIVPPNKKLFNYLFRLVLITLLFFEDDFEGPELDGPGELSSAVPFAVGRALFFPLPDADVDMI